MERAIFHINLSADQLVDDSRYHDLALRPTSLLDLQPDLVARPDLEDLGQHPTHQDPLDGRLVFAEFGIHDLPHLVARTHAADGDLTLPVFARDPRRHIPDRLGTQHTRQPG